MRKILLVLSGNVAKELLTTLIDKHSDKNQYLVVSNDLSIIPPKLPESFDVHLFDPTSAHKFEAILSKDISDAFVILDQANERGIIYDYIRRFSSRIRLTILDGEKNPHDKNLESLAQLPLITNRLIERLPNVPVLARNIGLGEGEIMQVSVPFGSSFAYRTIGSIQQKNWKIVALYRGGRMILAKYSLMIQPNDSLLLIGEPNVLNEVYRRVKEERGQFPAPFGSRIFLYCDMSRESKASIHHQIGEALWLHKHLNNKRIYIRVINPRDFELLNELKALNEEFVHVSIEYHLNTLSDVIKHDMENLGSIGLILLSEKLFSTALHRRILHELGVPVIKLGEESFKDCKESIIVLNDNLEESEKISSVIFDLASQLNHEVWLYDFEPDGAFRNESLEHYDNISRIVNKKLEIITSSTQNPILWLKKRSNFLQILPYNRSVARARFFWFFSTDIERLCFQLKKHHQLFVPVSF
ncbi:MAG: COG3400 family protein [Wolinella sp.]